MRILFDLDGIVADFLGDLLLQYNLRTGEGVRGCEIKDWNMMKFVRQPKLLEHIFHEPGFFLQLREMPGAVDAIKTLMDDGHEPVILSSPCTPHSASEKIEWCAKHLPFVPAKSVFIGHHKFMVKADALIDDGLHNAVAYRKAWPKSFIGTVAYPYNEDPELSTYNVRHGDGTTADGSVDGWLKLVDSIQYFARVWRRRFNK